MNATASSNVSPGGILPAAELNKVQGFDPRRFLRKTKDGPVLDLKFKKLWFRLKYPAGRIKVSALKITEQIAIIEARVYFSKDDTEPISTFIAQRNAADQPLYIEAAQYAAADQALSDAGFGIQLLSAGPKEPTEKAPIATGSFEITQPPDTPPKASTQAESAQKEPEPPSVVSEATPPQDAVPQADPQPDAADIVQDIPAPEPDNIPEQADAPAEQVVEITEQAEIPAAPPRYTPDMPVDDIFALMTPQEAESVVVDIGTCNGWTLSEVLEKRPASLKWYLNGYPGDNNILRAGARLLLEQSTMQKAG